MNNIPGDIETFFLDKYSNWEGGDQFKGTGERLKRFITESCWDSYRIGNEIEKCLKSVFIDSYDEMLSVRDMEVWTLCPHHLLPCSFNVNIGYIPTGRVLGLSKFTRIAVALGKRPVMQEMYTRELASTLSRGLNPEGIGIYVIGRHGCMSCRGIKQSQSSVTTTILTGTFKEDSEVRQEFYNTVGGK